MIDVSDAWVVEEFDYSRQRFEEFSGGVVYAFRPCEEVRRLRLGALLQLKGAVKR